jgi:hypothetical protein
MSGVTAMPESASNLSSRLTIQLNAFFVIWRTRSILICTAFINTPDTGRVLADG